MDFDEAIELLELPTEFDERTLKKAYYKKALLYHNIIHYAKGGYRKSFYLFPIYKLYHLSYLPNVDSK